MTDRLPLSVFIVAQDEADRIGRAIASVAGWAAEVVVIDGGSLDDTPAVAERLGARVLHNPWPGFGPQKRFGEAQCGNDWLLNLDADEAVEPALAAEIRALFAQGRPACDGYAITIVNVMPFRDRPLPGGRKYRPIRLYDRRCGRFADSLTWDSVEMAPGARVGRLKGRLLHYSLRSLEHRLDKGNRYTSLQARELAAAGRRVQPLRLLVEFPLAFLRYYFLRGHWLNGWDGYVLAMTAAYLRLLRLAKLREEQRRRRERPG